MSLLAKFSKWFASSATLVALAVTAAELKWEKLPPLPDAHGFAGPFAAVSQNVLLVAGGANFPDKMPWEGGEKVWHDTVFALKNPNGSWRAAGKLPQPLGYGVTVSHGREIICIGGSDSKRHYDEVFSLNWTNGEITVRSLPSLPEARANMCGASVNGTIFVAGGTVKPDATMAADTLFDLSLYLTRPFGWRRLEIIPGPGRIFATAGAHDDSFFVFGGASLKAGPDGKPIREWLRDAYRYTPGRGWKRIADLPRVAVAAPSPAPLWNGKLLIIGGDDGTQVNTPPNEHKGFRHDVLAYDPNADKWETLADAPFAFVTTPTVEWSDRIVIPGGEIRPGVRSPEVWALQTK